MIAAVGISPTEGSTRCIEPPRPPAQPMVRPQISPITPCGVTPSASAWRMAAIGAGDDVVDVDRAGDADGDRLLAARQMRRAAHMALAEQLLDALLDEADFHHAAQLLDAVGQRLAAGDGRIGIGRRHDAFLHQGAGDAVARNQRGDLLGDIVGARQEARLEIAIVGNRGVGQRDAQRRRLQLAERVGADGRDDVGAPAAAGGGFLDGDQPAGLPDRIEHGLAVPRPQRQQVDHLGVEPVLLGGRLGDAHHRAAGDDRRVLALAHDLGLAERQAEAVGLESKSSRSP